MENKDVFTMLDTLRCVLYTDLRHYRLYQVKDKAL